jgi:DNA-binding NarL/FixJ family response regulator
MMRTVQLAVADAVYAEALREALSHSGPWNVKAVAVPDPALHSVLVVDESAFARLARPLAYPERVVLITRQDPELLAQAWEAGIVSVVSRHDSLATVLLAVMAAALRVANVHGVALPSEISPTIMGAPAPITAEIQTSRSRRCKTR